MQESRIESEYLLRPPRIDATLLVRMPGMWRVDSFGFEEIGFLAPNLRTQNAKIRRFEELDEVEQYGTNWQ